MDLKKVWNRHRKDLLKAAGLLVVLLIVYSLFQSLSGSSRTRFGLGESSLLSIPGTAMQVGRNAVEEAMDYDYAAPSAGKAIISPIPPITPPAGNNAEEFEVTEYQASIRTRTLKKDCESINSLKRDPDIIFEEANEYDNGCHYSFKAVKEKTQSILGIINSMNPDNLSENTFTIKRTLDTLASEQEILERKMTSIEETLEDALRSYDEIISLANETRDAETLASVIESKLRIIESLTQQRLATREQLDRLLQAKADQEDRLNYTFFSVSITEDNYIDVDDVKDSWKNALQAFVQSLNSIAQALTIGLVALLFFAAQYIIYFFLLLMIAKFVWKRAKQLWKK